RMINDPKSAMFIQWTELGTSFVVSNVGEFSRTILGTHFKHNNFSSFVRQLNMYGFHKINRTPRGTRATSGSGQGNGPGSAEQQVWEFSHHKFLRGRPDLLDEIKRKALDPDPAVKQRVELPGELAAQLNQMRDNNRRVVRALEWERAKVNRLVGVVRDLNEVIGRAFPGSGK
ncbi:winged helix DNA-binding domain-containing protein, partial [Fomitiporia mediterranea MF3/22]|uniref:winged helix DNA-binding domain-containing protein n=1 Tax=Fomitiporia mediterranea (strain MF3/22) TaxID=694068 RepID=UPI0004407CB7